MPNRLAGSSSAYLRQHAENPVDWYPWGEEALQKARDEDKPIFLSIGYSACHWCHVMERESFESAKTAEIMNKVFVNIKVDREERPDVDAIYLKSVVLMTGHGGWPTSVWLTPDLKPFYGGTYFPPVPRPGQPSFAQVLLSLAVAWRDKRDEISASAEELLDAVRRLSEVANIGETAEGTAWLGKAVAVCEAQYDDRYGGFGGAPKFPQAMTLRFLLLHGRATGDKEVLEIVEHSAEAMARGGLYDQLGGGFHRYSVDVAWQVPHFEKMLYDNALLLGVYADLVAHSGKPLYRWVVETLVDWLGREMALPNGGFASSTDADSEGEEGRFFVWSPTQLAQALDENERQLFAAFYGVTSSGNFEGGASVLTQKQTLSRCAKSLGWDFELAVSVLESARQKALAVRAGRVSPERDDKAVAAWNAQTVSALCRAASQAELPAARDLALTAGRFLQAHFTKANSSGEVGRVVGADGVQGSAQAEDVGSLVLAFFDLYELTLDDEWLTTGLAMFKLLGRDFWDEERQLTAMTSPRTVDIPLRPFSFEDNATPSAHSLLLECARRHHRLTGDPGSKDLWEKATASVKAMAQRAPTGLGLALQSAALCHHGQQELVLTGSAEQARPFLQALHGKFLPHLTVVRATSPGVDPELGKGKEPGKAYLCSGSSCQPPVTEPEALEDLLSALPL